ncbi:MAG TPA: hypothetical protein VNG29_00495 [Candidatus Paceibacterota bacterium]|nr:hypothetical protein [Candidatus Paceibacterota bacterium]
MHPGCRDEPAEQFFHEAGTSFGLSKAAPFDKILVSAAGDAVPPELVDQLKTRSVMVIPIRDAIWRIKKISSTDIQIEPFGRFVFVPPQ